MTDKNKTEIAVVLDRSGSMATIQADMVGGFATFREEQRRLPGECVMSLYQFDDSHETIYEECPIASAVLLLQPRGSTALYDAVGRSITRIGERLARKPESERPGALIVLIITDGQENASREFTHASVSKLIQEQETKYNWRFAFMGAAGLGDARLIGVAAQSSATYTANAAGVRGMYQRSSRGIGSYRNAVVMGSVGASLNIAPEDDDPGQQPTKE